MTFKEIVDATLSGGFAEAQRSDAKRWVNARLAWLWGIENWTFKQGTATVTVTAGSVTNVPADFVAALAIFRSDGTPLAPIVSYPEFSEAYIGTSSPGVALGEAFTVLGSSIFLGPTGTSGSYTLVYKKGSPTLVNDSDVPGIPTNYHLALVHGAKAEGFKLNAVPSMADALDADFQAYIAAMRGDYLQNFDVPVQTPAYIP